MAAFCRGTGLFGRKLGLGGVRGSASALRQRKQAQDDGDDHSAGYDLGCGLGEPIWHHPAPIIGHSALSSQIASRTIATT